MVGNYITSFIGFLPANNPEVVVYIAVDNAKGITQYGGTIAAPIARTILKESILPNDDKNGIIFLAAHSGSGHLAYFKDLDKLQNGDNVIFTYNNVIYTYQVVDVFEEEKDGDIEISKSNSEQLVLTTCSPHNDDKQLIVDTILINEKRVN